jgi:hypothetical protein
MALRIVATLFMLCSVTVDNYYGQLRVRGTLANRTDADWTNLMFRVVVFDEKGNPFKLLESFDTLMLMTLKKDAVQALNERIAGPIRKAAEGILSRSNRLLFY